MQITSLSSSKSRNRGEDEGARMLRKWESVAELPNSHYLDNSDEAESPGVEQYYGLKTRNCMAVFHKNKS